MASRPKEVAIARLVDRFQYKDKPVVKHHLSMLARAQENLNPGEEHYYDMSHGGRDSYVVKMEGTIPTVHQLQTYYTPIEVVVPLNYPHEAPVVWVKQLEGMHISTDQSLVDREGRVRVTWNPRQNLAQLIQDLARRFGHEPPLRSGNPLDPAQKALNDVTDMCAEMAHFHYKGLHDRLIKEMVRGATIESRAEQLDASMSRLRAAKATLTTQLERLTKAVDSAGVDEGTPELEAGSVVENQMFGLVAKVLAVEDTIFALDKAVENETITVEAFVKSVRKLAREQFEARALVNKIWVLQEQHAKSRR